MILQSLYALYDRLEGDPSYRLPQPGYSLQRVSFKVVLRPNGMLFEIQDARQPAGNTLGPRQELVPGITKPSGSGLNPCFLWDNSAYMLGYRSDDKAPERTAKSFAEFRKKHLAVEEAVGSPQFSAVCRFLETWTPGASEIPTFPEAATHFGVFQIQGVTSFVHEDTPVKGWWEEHGWTEALGAQGQCLVTGKEATLARIHPRIKGVSGAQGSGATIAGFNEAAYESYGKTQSYNAPVGQAAAFRYATALNALLDGPKRQKHKLSLGGTTVAFWTDPPGPTEDIFAKFAARGSDALQEVQDEGQRKKLEAFLRALSRGRRAYAEIEHDPDRTSFFLLGLGSNAARIAVRFFHRGTLGELLANLRHHYADIAIQRQYEEHTRRPDPEFPSLQHLLGATCPWRGGKRDRRKLNPLLEGSLLTAVITGTRYPQSLYSAVLRRLHANPVVDYATACVIQGYLSRNLSQEASMTLDVKRTDPGYRLGRLFSALEKTQGDALGQGLGATIRDRFYSSGSATPRTVFPRLLRTYQHHLAKLEGGRKVNREKLVQEILEPLTDFPAHLNLAEQGLFALGYYHQTRDFYTSGSVSETTANDALTDKEDTP